MLDLFSNPILSFLGHKNIPVIKPIIVIFRSSNYNINV